MWGTNLAATGSFFLFGSAKGGRSLWTRRPTAHYGRQQTACKGSTASRFHLDKLTHVLQPSQYATIRKKSINSLSRFATHNSNNRKFRQIFAASFSLALLARRPFAPRSLRSRACACGRHALCCAQSRASPFGGVRTLDASSHRDESI